MLWRGRVESYLRSKASAGERAVLLLVDPDPSRFAEDKISRTAPQLRSWGFDAILVGGSLGVSESSIDRAVEILRSSGLPIILFPSNVSGISSKADAILFMSLLNSIDPYYIVGVQTAGAPIVKRYGLEALPTAYLIVGEGGAAGHIGWARPLPPELAEVGAAYAMAAEMMGMRFIYLESGSGSKRPVPPELVRAVRSSTGLYIIVGGGIRSPETAAEIALSGADAIVLGTVFEKDPEAARAIAEKIKGLGREIRPA